MWAATLPLVLLLVLSAPSRSHGQFGIELGTKAARDIKAAADIMAPASEKCGTIAAKAFDKTVRTATEIIVPTLRDLPKDYGVAGLELVDKTFSRLDKFTNKQLAALQRQSDIILKSAPTVMQGLQKMAKVATQAKAGYHTVRVMWNLPDAIEMLAEATIGPQQRLAFGHNSTNPGTGPRPPTPGPAPPACLPFELSRSTMIACTIGVTYIVSPIDAIPDFIPIFGLVDDCAVLLIVMKTLDDEITRFQHWKDFRAVYRQQGLCI